MEVKISHSISWWEGGIELDETIRRVCNLLKMKEGQYSIYTPNYMYLQYEEVTTEQFNTLIKKLKGRKILEGINLKLISNKLTFI